jgi:hypothetical protein
MQAITAAAARPRVLPVPLAGQVEDALPRTRALVPVGGFGTHLPPRRPVRPAADFVAHLVATAQCAPQTRMLRRAAPSEAAAAYGRNANARLPVAGTGRLSATIV